MITPTPMPADTIAPWRLNLLRLCYALIAFVMGAIVWPQLLAATPDWPIMRGVAKSMLAALSLLCVLGLFFPLRMLPLLIFEMAWKTIWILLIALPAWTSGQITNAQIQTFYECVGVVVIYAVLPWDHVWRAYLRGQIEPFFTSKPKAG